MAGALPLHPLLRGHRVTSYEYPRRLRHEVERTTKGRYVCSACGRLPDLAAAIRHVVAFQWRHGAF